jgi:hypothetical protein
MIGGNRVPIVFNNVKPVRPLAGGNFYYVARDFGDRKGHNVDGVTSIDSKFRGFPPGYDRSLDPSLTGYNPAKPLACAGSNGCHGNRNIEDQQALLAHIMRLLLHRWQPDSQELQILEKCQYSNRCSRL